MQNFIVLGSIVNLVNLFAFVKTVNINKITHITGQINKKYKQTIVL